MKCTSYSSMGTKTSKSLIGQGLYDISGSYHSSQTSDRGHFTSSPLQKCSELQLCPATF